MKKLMILCAMFLLASCSKTAIEEVTIGATDYEFTAYAPDGQTDARTYVDEQMKLHWTKNDLITIFHGMLEPLKFGFRGETGATSGTYYNVDGIFYAPDQSAPNNVAVYPYSADHLLDENTRAVTLTMPAEQTYVENSFGLGANTMIAVTSEVNDLALYFKNVGTYLNVRLWGENQTVKTITVTATGGEALSGKAVVTPTYGGDPTCVMANTGTAPSVQLVCEEAVTVNTTEDAPVSFWIVLPPVTMASGFNVMVENADGEKQVFTIDKSVTFKRNKYNTLTRELAVVAEEKIPNNEIHYTATEQVTPYITDVFGATYLASQSTYNGTTQQGMLKFDGDVTTIGEYAFYYCDALTSITIPNSVTTIGRSAFGYCKALTSVTIPNSVTTIGSSAFCNCSSLTSIRLPEGVAIGNSAFLDCDALTSVTIPKNATLGLESFSECDGLLFVELKDGWYFNGGLPPFCRCVNLQKAVIGKTSSLPSSDMFSGCYNLTTFEGEHTSADGRCLIDGNYLISFAPGGLTLYAIPDGITRIADYAFAYDYDNTGTILTSITLPASVCDIGINAFSITYWSGEKRLSFHCKAVTPPHFSYIVSFPLQHNAKEIYIPRESYDAYRAAWGDDLNFIPYY